jgi:cold shock CspA family protein
MTGFVHRIEPLKRFCFIMAEGEEFFAHRRDFPNPESMKEGQYVSFVPGTRIKGKKNRPAMALALVERAA